MILTSKFIQIFTYYNYVVNKSSSLQNYLQQKKVALLKMNYIIVNMKIILYAFVTVQPLILM